MSINSLGPSSNSALLEQAKQRRAALQAMMDAVQSGDIQDAQKDLGVVQANLQDKSGDAPGKKDEDSQSGWGNNFRVTIKTDLSLLMSAVQSGDLSQSQDALAKLKSDAPYGFAKADAISSKQTFKNFREDLRSLVSAVKSGDADAAKSIADSMHLPMGAGAYGSFEPSQGKDQPLTNGQGGSAFFKDLSDLIAAAQSGDIASAQSALEKFSSNVQPVSGGPRASAPIHHLHHHGGGGGPKSAEPTSPQSDLIDFFSSLV